MYGIVTKDLMQAGAKEIVICDGYKTYMVFLRKLYY